jgi:hypothetical protein
MNKILNDKGLVEKTCEECFKIKCRECGWEHDDEQVVLIKKEILMSCPVCNWAPGANIS